MFFQRVQIDIPCLINPKECLGRGVAAHIEVFLAEAIGGHGAAEQAARAFLLLLSQHHCAAAVPKQYARPCSPHNPFFVWPSTLVQLLQTLQACS